MNKKVLGVFVSLLAVALLTVPVMGAPATKIEGVTVTHMAIRTTISSRLVDHNIWHNRGLSTGTVTINIPGQDPLLGTRYAEPLVRLKWSNYPDPDPEAELLIVANLVLTFTGEGTTGTFEGVIHRRITGWSLTGAIPGVTYFEDHVVFRGTGDFQGWTLKLSFEGAPPAIQEGYLIMPK